MDEIGQKLRTARIDKGYTLDDLQQITKIQKRYLIAIEEGDFDALPGDFYVRAFIKQFADTVGLDSEALLTQFQQDIPDTQPQEYVEQSVESQTRKTRAEASTPVNKVRRYLPQIVLVVIALVIFAVVYGVTIHNSRNSKPAIPNDSSSITVSSQAESKKVKAKKASASSESAASAKAASSSKAAAEAEASAKAASSADAASAKAASSKAASSKAAAEAEKAAKASKKTAKKDAKKTDAKKLAVEVGADANANQAVTVKNWPDTENTVTIAATDSAAWVSVLINNATTWQGMIEPGSEHAVTLPAGTTAFAVKSGNATVTTIKLNKTKVDISKGTSIVRTINFNTESAGN